MATVLLTSFPVPEDVLCPECKSNVKLYDPYSSSFYVCRSCNSYIQYINYTAKKLKPLKPLKQKPFIPIGTEGILEGVSFKVIGYMEREEEQAAQYAWREYVLYNFDRGYAMLTEFDGHWNVVYGKNFLAELNNLSDATNSVLLSGIKYRLFHKYTPKTTGMLGEFDWDALGERISVQEFIAPPFIVVKEKTHFKKTETAYYRGEYQEPKAIAKAFSVDLALFPAKSGILSNQPSKAYSNWIWSIRATLFAILALMLIQLFVVYNKPEETLMDQVFDITYDSAKGGFEFKPFVTPSFNVSDASSSMEIELMSDVNNNWLEATTVLVNEKTNQTWEVTEGVEYYQGVEDGERWTEGNTRTDVLLSEIPQGRYHLNVYPASGDPLRDRVLIKVIVNGTLWRNLICCILLLALIPFFYYLMMRNFEKKRWSNSNYSPFEE